MTEFLEYELLSPETADPVVIRITGQKARGFERFIASNGVNVCSYDWPAYYHYPTHHPNELMLRGDHRASDGDQITIPLSDWPAVKQAIRELNEAKHEEEKRERFRQLFEKTERDMKNWPEWKKRITLLETSSTDACYKEKDMDTKKIDEYSRMVRDIAALVEPVGYDLLVNPDATLTVTRKKPKVEDELRAKYEELVDESCRYDEGISRMRLFELLAKIVAALNETKALEDRANGGKE